MTDKKLRVAIITPGTFPIPSPFSSSVETVIERYTNVLQNDVDFMILGKKTKELPALEKRGNITFIRFPFKTWGGYITKVSDALSKLDVDIIQIENRPKYIPYFKKAFTNKTIILSLHSTKFISKSHIAIDDLKDSLSIADKIIVNSHFLKNVLAEKSGCEDGKIMVNHLGVDTHQFRSKWSEHDQNIAEVKKQLDMEEENILLFVGRLKKIKGVHLLLKALPSILAEAPNTILIIVGNTSYHSSKQTKYSRLLHNTAAKLSEHVRFVPFVPHDQIQKWYACADISLVPSIGKEAFGLVNVEAMATGVPVIATNIGGMQEVIKDGTTGFLLNPTEIKTELPNYVLRLLKNPELRKQMGEYCVQHVRNNFTWEKSANRLLHLYQELSKPK